MNINGQIIKKYRIEKGYTQQELADMMNVDAKTVQKWESGKSGIKSKNLVKLIDILNIPKINNDTDTDKYRFTNIANVEYPKKEIDIMAIFLSFLMILVLTPIVRDTHDIHYKVIGFVAIYKEVWQIMNKIRGKS